TRAAEVVVHLERGENVAVVSDAGMPGINDPGYRLVALAIRHHIRVVPVPGASAFLSALVASGLPTDSFRFGGFLPPKAGARRTALEAILSSPRTQLFTKHHIASSSLCATSSKCLEGSATSSSRAKSRNCTRSFCAAAPKTYWCNLSGAAKC